MPAAAPSGASVRTATAGPSSRALGAYYTPRDAAHAMASWALRRGDEVVLEPSFGDGVFLRALKDVCISQSLDNVVVHGVELDSTAFERVAASTVKATEAHCGDFLSLRPFAADVVIGNPPYVRLRHLPDGQARRALEVGRETLQREMDPAGSVWMPFILHALRFLRRGGRMALVLPYEATYVRYARDLWEALGRSFGLLRVVRVKERLFPSILQGVVVLFADEYGASTSQVEFAAYESLDAFLVNRPTTQADIPVTSITLGERPFIEALLPASLRHLLHHLRPATTEVRNHVDFHIGYVAGDKRFFHPSTTAVADFGIPERSLLTTLTSSRRTSGRGVLTSQFPASALSRLFYPPDPEHVDKGERAYIALGERAGVNARYKCRVRNPWYRVPDVRTPDFFLPTFAERPVLLVNDAEYVASNSFLCGYIRSSCHPRVIAGAWYTSLTLLEGELQVHSLGGGVMVYVPREAGRIRIVHPDATMVDLVAEASKAMHRGGADAAFHVGDEPVLCRRLGLARGDIDLIQDGIERLREWRNSKPDADGAWSGGTQVAMAL